MDHFGPFWSCECQNPVRNKVTLTKMVVLTILHHFGPVHFRWPFPMKIKLQPAGGCSVFVFRWWRFFRDVAGLRFNIAMWNAACNSKCQEVSEHGFMNGSWQWKSHFSVDSQLKAQLTKQPPQNSNKGISLSKYGSKGFRVRLRRLSEYGSVACSVEHGKHGRTVLGHRPKMTTCGSCCGQSLPSQLRA